MRLNDYKLIFFAVGLISILLIATPTLGAILRLPNGEKFSELYILGPGHMAEDYPFNVAVGQNYSVYVGVGNYMASSTYYVLYVKFGNQTDLLPNATTGTPSPLPHLYEYRFIVRESKSWESPLDFSISGVSFSENMSFVNSLTIDGITFDVNKPAVWDVKGNVFYYQLVFELWIYNPQTDSVEFNNRFVDLRFNLTENAQSFR